MKKQLLLAVMALTSLGSLQASGTNLGIQVGNKLSIVLSGAGCAWLVTQAINIKKQLDIIEYQNHMIQVLSQANSDLDIKNQTKQNLFNLYTIVPKGTGKALLFISLTLLIAKTKNIIGNNISAIAAAARTAWQAQPGIEQPEPVAEQHNQPQEEVD